MRRWMLILAIAVAAVSGLVPAQSLVIVQAPRPDVRLFLLVPQEKLGDMRRVLMKFATQEHLTEFKNPPRAKGKQFFLSLYSDGLSFVAEKSNGSRSVMIECYDLNSNYHHAQARNYGVAETPFDIVIQRLEQSLKSVSSNISEER